jgi:hypothetical protein
VKCTIYEAPHYAIFSSLPPLPPAPCSETPVTWGERRRLRISTTTANELSLCRRDRRLSFAKTSISYSGSYDAVYYNINYMNVIQIIKISSGKWDEEETKNASIKMH